MSDRGPAARTVVEGRYQLEAPLERWGLGEAWQARDKNFRSRSVVLKFFPGVDAARLEDAAQELRAQRSLKHPQVMAVLAQGVHDGVPWVAYDGFEGTPLARLLDDERRAKPLLDAGRARDLFEKVLDAFTAAHEAATPVLHGCLQPASVLVGKTSVKVLDFGLGSLAGDAQGVFRAPELGPDTSATVAGDVYALGVTLCELLLPPRALEAFLGSLVRDGVAAGRAHRPEIDTSLWDAVTRAIARVPASAENRPHSPVVIRSIRVHR